MAEHDLTRKIIPYIDRHLAIPLLERLANDTSLFPQAEILLAQYELSNGTNMLDWTAKLFEQLYPDQDAPEGTPSIARNTVRSYLDGQNSLKSAKRQWRRMRD